MLYRFSASSFTTEELLKMLFTPSHLTRRALLVVSTLALTSSTVLAADFTAKIGHLESDQQSRHVHLLKVAELVKDRTNGAVEFQIFPLVRGLF